MRLLRTAWCEGLEVFLYDGKLSAHRGDGQLTEGDKRFLKFHKKALVAEIQNLTTGPRINGEDFYGPSLMADATRRCKRNNQNHGQQQPTTKKLR